MTEREDMLRLAEEAARKAIECVAAPSDQLDGLQSCLDRIVALRSRASKAETER